MPPITDPAILRELNAGGPGGQLVKPADGTQPYKNRRTVNDAVASDYAPEQARTSLIKDKADIERDKRVEAREDRKVNDSRTDKKFEQEAQLRKDFAADKAVIAYREAAPYIATALRARPGGEGDLSIIYGWAKTLDPTGSVRDADADLAQSASPVWSKVKQVENQVRSGNLMSPEARHGLIEEMRSVGKMRYRQYRTVYSNAVEQAKAYNLNPAILGPDEATQFEKEEADWIKRNGGTPRYSDGTISQAAADNAFKRGPVGPDDDLPEIVGGSVGKPKPGRMDAFGEGMVDTLTFGLRDELGAAGDAFGRSLRGEGAFGDLYGQSLGNIRDDQQRLANGDHSGWYMGGQATGALAGGLTGGLALRGATGAIGSRLAARNALGFDAAYGAGYGAGSGEGVGGRLGGAAIGATAGAGGNMLGTYVAAPLVKNAMSSRPIDGIRRALGINQAPQALTRAQQTVIGQAETGGLPAVRNNLVEAQSFNLPYTLADSSPQLRLLAGAATRKAPNARELAEQVIDPRSLDQSGRLTQAINRDLGPTANVDQASRDLMERARADAAPLYETFNAEGPKLTSPELDSLLQTPAGRAALSRARTIAANDRIDPTTIGFDLDAEGNVAIVRNWTPRTVDYVKRGLDDVLESSRDPVTGRIPYNEATRAIENVRSGFVREADRIYPSYAPAREAYGGPASINDALQLGRQGPKLSPDDVNQALGRFNPNQTDAFRLGYRSNLADRAADMSDTANPWMATTGAPSKREKLTTLFPEGAPNFLRQAGLERNMGRTSHELLGGSPTAARQAMDETFNGGWTDAAGEVAGSLLTGQAPGGVFSRLAQRGADTLRVGLGTSRADEIARVLLNPDTGANISALDNLGRLAAERAQWGRKYDEMARRAAVGGLLPFAGGF